MVGNLQPVRFPPGVTAASDHNTFTSVALTPCSRTHSPAYPGSGRQPYSHVDDEPRTGPDASSAQLAAVGGCVEAPPVALSTCPHTVAPSAILGHGSFGVSELAATHRSGRASRCRATDPCLADRCRRRGLSWLQPDHKGVRSAHHTGRGNSESRRRRQQSPPRHSRRRPRTQHRDVVRGGADASTATRR